MSCLVVEDEPEARACLERWIGETAGLRWIGSAMDGDAAARLLDELRPDLVFLDIRLPERDGFAALAGAGHRPQIVFTTADAGHALAAFELGAIDYLLKPFGRQRFAAAVERCLARRELAATDPPALERWRGASGEHALERIFVRKAGALIPLPTREILRLEARAEYVRVHSRRGTFLLRITLKELAGRLDPERFAWLHRSHVVNLDAVVELRRADDRRLEARLDDGSTVIASRAASERLRERMRQT